MRRKNKGGLGLKYNFSSESLNDATYIHYFNRLSELAMTCFKWKNLPDTCDERFLEYTLFREGQAVFFVEPVIGPMATQCSYGGPINVYQNPTTRYAYGANFNSVRLTEENSVIIWNNQIRTPSIGDAQLYANRLTNISRTIDINVHAQKTPLMIICDESQRLSMENLYKKYEGNEPIIYGNKKNFDLSKIESLNTNAPFISSQLQQLKQDTWNEAVSNLGIPNVSINKNERLASVEVSRSMGTVYASRYSRLYARKAACEKINALFGLDVDVEFNDDIYNQYENAVAYNAQVEEVEEVE